jgi:hypothetical protein
MLLHFKTRREEKQEREREGWEGAGNGVGGGEWCNKKVGGEWGMGSVGKLGRWCV